MKSIIQKQITQKVWMLLMPIYSLIEYSDNHLKISRILWQYCRNEPAVDGNGNIVGFNPALY